MTHLTDRLFPAVDGAAQVRDPVLVFALVMLLILIAPMLFSRMRVPGIVGLIVAGILAGPHGAGWFALDATFELLGKVGLLYLMFLAGLEINMREFARQRRHSLVFGVLTFVIPQVGGALSARWLFGFGWPTAILLASMFASHTLVTYPILAQLNLTRSRAVTTAIGGTILTDIAALMVLALVEQTAVGSLTALFWVRQSLLLLLLVLGVLWLLPRLGYWFFRRAQPDPVSEYLFIVAAAFLCSYAAKLAGVEPIIGAFLAGLALGQLVPERGVLMNRIQFMGHALFIPFFLLSVGMRVDLAVLSGGLRVWAIAGFMTGAVHLAKWLAAELSGRALGYNPAERGLIFGISVNQAAATLAAVLVGERIGLFGADIMNGTILMILVSCLVGSWATDRFGRRVGLAAEALPEPAPAEDRILIPLGNRMNADALMDFALLLRGRKAREPLYPLNVALDGPDADVRVAEGEALLQRAVVRAVAASVPVEPLTRLDTNRAGGILRAIREKRISCVILGWRKRESGPGRFFRDLLDQVLEHTSTSLFVTRLPQPLNATRRILLLLPPLIDRQPGFVTAFRRCLRLSNQMGARILGLGDAEILRVLSDGRSLPAPPAWRAIEIPDWARWPEKVREIAEPTDMLAMIAARRGRIPWQPALERALQRLDADCPAHNLLVLYPSEPGWDPDEEPVPACAAIERAVFIQTDTPLEAALEDLVRKMVPDPEAVAPIVRELRAAAPVMLADGIALLHTHSPHVAGTRIGLIVGRAGATIRFGESSLEEVFLLLSEQGIPPGDHLYALAGIARMSRSSALVERIRRAETEADCRLPVPPAGAAPE